MNFIYHIQFGNKSNPYVSLLNDKNIIKKSIRKWLKTPNFWEENKIEIFSENFNFKIDNSTEETWTVWKKNKFNYYIPIAEYYKLGNAINYLERNTIS